MPANYSPAKLSEAPHKIILMTYPRIFGYAFNPLSVYFVYNQDETLIGMRRSAEHFWGVIPMLQSRK